MPVIIRAEKAEAQSRVHALDLDPDLLFEVVKMAVSAAIDSTPDDPVNAPGTFSYIYGTRGLRQSFCGEVWLRDRSNSVESIFHPEKQLRVIFQNVDWAADPHRVPKPRSKKGAGSERACLGNQLRLDLPDPPAPADSDSDAGVMTFYLMVSHNGDDVRAELSRPVVKDEKFVSFIERNFLIRGGEWNEIGIIDDGDDEGGYDLDIEVFRRS